MLFGAYSPKLSLPIRVYLTEFPGLNICGPSSQIMLLMFLSNCYLFCLLLLLSSLYCFWLLIPRISCLIQKVSLGSLRSLFSMFLPLSITTVNCCFPAVFHFITVLQLMPKDVWFYVGWPEMRKKILQWTSRLTSVAVTCILIAGHFFGLYQQIISEVILWEKE